MSKETNSLAISVQDVTKVYRLYEKPIDRLKESMSISHKSYHRDFYASRWRRARLWGSSAPTARENRRY